MFEPKELETIKSGLKQGFEQVFVVENSEAHLIGCICLSTPPDSSEISEIVALVISPDNLHQGIGTQLVEFAQDYLKQKTQIRNLFLTTADYAHPLSQTAQAFYKKLGFEEVGRIPNYWGEGDHKIFFYKPI